MNGAKNYYILEKKKKKDNQSILILVFFLFKAIRKLHPVLKYMTVISKKKKTKSRAFKATPQPITQSIKEYFLIFFLQTKFPQSFILFS
jgi:hypothetical protein